MTKIILEIHKIYSSTKKGKKKKFPFLREFESLLPSMFHQNNNKKIYFNSNLLEYVTGQKKILYDAM